jgi:hypothetical protein
VVLRPLFAEALAVRRRYLLDHGTKAAARGAARCASQVLDRGAQADAAAPRMSSIVVYRPLPAAPLVARCMYMAEVPGLMPASVASLCFRRRFQQLACACGS